MPRRFRILLPTYLSVLSLSVACGQQTVDEEAENFQAAFEELNDGKDDGIGCSGVKVADRGPFDRQVALTFDDGPNPATTPQILETLRRYDAPATFFINGKNANSDAARRIVEEIVSDPLFTLANHTWSHKKMTSLSLSSAAAQIDDTSSVISAAGGDPFYFRFPYGASNCSTMELVNERSLKSIGWHVDSADWCFARGDGYCSEDVFGDPALAGFRGSMGDYILHQVNKRSLQGGIVLFHDIHRSTARDLDGILSSLVAEGFSFVALDAETFPETHGVTPAPRAFIGDKCTNDQDCNFSGGFCMPEVDGGLCTQECSGSCPDRAGYATTRCVEPPVGVTDFTVCALSCAQTSCREGTSCQVLPSGQREREVCF